MHVWLVSEKTFIYTAQFLDTQERNSCNTNFFLILNISIRTFLFQRCWKLLPAGGLSNFLKAARSLSQVDSTVFAESAESAENHNFLSSLIKQPKNYPETYPDTFSQILSAKNNSNFIFLQFRVFVCGPVPKNENAEFAEGFKKFHLLYQCWIVVTVHRMITRYLCLYTLQITFQTCVYPFELF